MLAEEVAHDAVLVAVIVAVGGIMVALIQNGTILRRQRNVADAAGETKAAVVETISATEAWQEEVRSEIRALNRRFTQHEDRMVLFDAKLDGLISREDEHENGHLENGGEHG